MATPFKTTFATYNFLPSIAPSPPEGEDDGRGESLPAAAAHSSAAAAAMAAAGAAASRVSSMHRVSRGSDVSQLTEGSTKGSGQNGDMLPFD